MAAGKGVELHGPVVTIVSISVIMVLVFTLGKRGVNWVTKHVQDESGWQSGTVMVFAFLLALGLAIASGLAMATVAAVPERASERPAARWLRATFGRLITIPVLASSCALDGGR